MIEKENRTDTLCSTKAQTCNKQGKVERERERAKATKDNRGERLRGEGHNLSVSLLRRFESERERA